MRALSPALLGLAVVACAGPSDPAGDTGDTGDGAPTGPVTLNVWMPEEVASAPGAWLDARISAVGDLGAGEWTLSIEGLPPSVTGRFDPPTLSAAHGAVWRGEVGVDAAPFSAVATVHARRGDRDVEVPLTLALVDRSDLPPDFLVQSRAPIVVGPQGSTDTRPSADGALLDVQVLSVGGFEGDVHVLMQEGSVESVTPGVVHVAPGAPGRASGRVITGSVGAVVHRRTWHWALGALGVASTLAPLEPVATLREGDRLWLPPGSTATTAVRPELFMPEDQPWPDGVLTVTVQAPPGLTATRSPAAADRTAAIVTWEAQADATPDAYDIGLRATLGGVDAAGRQRVVVPEAPSGWTPLAFPLRRPDGAISQAFGIDLVHDAGGLAVDLQVASGRVEAHESAGFRDELFEGVTDIVRISGVLGGRVTASSDTVLLGVTEVRSDVGTRWWSLPVGIAHVPRALAYDASRVLWCATVESVGGYGVPVVYRMDATQPVAPVRLDGLGTTVIEGGPWIAAGVSPPVVAFFRDGALVVFQRAGAAWATLPAVTGLEVSTTVDLALAMDTTGRPVIAWADDSGVHVSRFGGGVWTALPDVAADADRVAMELFLAIDPDGGQPVVVWTDAAYVPPPAVRAAGLGAQVHVVSFDGGAWSGLGTLQQDPQAPPASPVAAFGPDGALVVAWMEDGAVFVVREVQGRRVGR